MIAGPCGLTPQELARTRRFFVDVTHGRVAERRSPTGALDTELAAEVVALAEALVFARAAAGAGARDDADVPTGADATAAGAAVTRATAAFDATLTARAR